VTSIQMPQLGETIIEGTILKWLKAEGDTIERDEPLFEISTDKVDTEVPSPVAGTVTKILVEEGATVPVGTELAEIDSGDGGAAGDASAGGGSASADAGSGGGQASGGSPGRAEPPAAAAPAAAVTPVAASAPSPSPAAAPPTPGPAATSGEAGSSGGVAASAAVPLADRGERSQILSPLVRKMAAEHSIDLSQVVGTGTGGRITKQDVQAVIAGGGTTAAAGAPAARPAFAPVSAPAVAGAGEEVVPMTKIRKLIAEHMHTSLQTSARAWNMVEVDFERIVRLRERAKDAFEAREGISLTYTSFVARATNEALLAFPQVNAELRGEDIVLKHYVNLGIAVSYDEGLIVPVIKGADTLNLVGLQRAITDLATRARSHQLKPDEITGGTFSITNPGPYGSMLSVPIIAQPQTAILAFDAIEKRPVVIDDAIAIRHRAYLSMSWDHRVIDGAMAAQFLARVKQNLETWDFAEDLGV
jgi:2-oxoglutarate dehydrogenase E2 component (dihydrolipoamide succinyltransferase)